MAAPQGVNFDGTNDYLSRGSDLSGNADGQRGIISFWVNRAADGDFTRVLYDQTGQFTIFFPGSNVVTLQGRNTSNTIILQMRTLDAITASSGWTHYLASWDLSVGALHLYVSDADSLDTSNDVATNATLNYTNPAWHVGALPNASQKFNGDFAQFYVNFSEYLDFSVEANRRKFVGAGAASSVDLGADGSTPTGNAPIIYLEGAASSWETNLGTGGGFAENGALADAATNPPDYADAGGAATIAVPNATAVTISPATPALATDAVPDRPDAVSLTMSPQAPSVGPAVSVSVPDASQIALSQPEPAASVPFAARPQAAGMTLSVQSPITQVARTVVVGQATEISLLNGVPTPAPATDAFISIPQSTPILLSIPTPDAFGISFAGQSGTVSVGRGLSYLEGVTDTRTTVGGKGVIEEIEEFE